MSNKRADNSMLKRIRFVAILLAVVCFAAVIVKLFHMQVIKYDFYQSKAESLQTREKILYPTRGTIYDTNGVVLARSVSVETISVTPKNVEEKAKIKESMVPWIIGIFVSFGAFGIWKILCLYILCI